MIAHTHTSILACRCKYLHVHLEFALLVICSDLQEWALRLYRKFWFARPSLDQTSAWWLLMDFKDAAARPRASAEHMGIHERAEVFEPSSSHWHREQVAANKDATTTAGRVITKPEQQERKHEHRRQQQTPTIKQTLPGLFECSCQKT